MVQKKEFTLEQLQQAVEEINNGKSIRSKATELGINDKTLRTKLEKAGLKTEIKVQTSTPKNADFTQEEIDTLKELIQERKRGYELFSEYRIYDELSKVPINAETVRNAYNMSKETTERLKKYANARRLPLQDLVELAVINLLDKYDK